MKSKEVNGWKIMGKVTATAIALSAGVAAQSAGNLDGSARVGGRAVIIGSLENDLHSLGHQALDKIALDRFSEQRLELSFQMRPRKSLTRLGRTLSIEEMRRTIVIENGTPGGVAVLHLGNRSPSGKAGGGIKIAGMFDTDGSFPIEIPADVDVGGLFAIGEDGRLVAHLGFLELVRKTGGGLAATDERPVTDVLNIEEASEEAFAHWTALWTDLQIRTDGRVRGSNGPGTGNNPQPTEPDVDPISDPQAAGEKILVDRVQVDTRPQLDLPGAGGASVFTGFIEPDGSTAVQIPADIDNYGFFSLEDGRLVGHLGSWELILKTGGFAAR